MMDETEQETLELRLDAEASQDKLPEAGKPQFLPTQTSCISLAVTERESSSDSAGEVAEDGADGNTGGKNQEGVLNSSEDKSQSEPQDAKSPSNDSNADESADQGAADGQHSSTPTDLDPSKNADKSDSSDESRIESPEPPNENSELNEMDTTFMGGASELDALSAAPPGSKDDGDKAKEAASDDESRMSSPKCGSDNEGDSDREDNEELREAMMDEDDEPEADRGPEISLPYKEPEQLSLQEFLARRRSKRSGADQIKEDRGSSIESTEKLDARDAAPSEERPKRKSKLHEEILKAAAKVTPQLSRSSFVAQTPVDELILKAVSMQSANATSPDAPKKLNNAVPGAQLKELKDALKEKIAEQRKRSRQERTKRILGKNFDGEPEEEEEEEDYETDEDDFDDEETMLAKAAKESDAGSEGEEEERDADDIADDEAEDDEEEPEPEDEPEPEEIDEDSDIEELTERRKSQKKKKKNAVQDSDDESERLDADSDEADDGDEDLNLKIQDDAEYEDDASFMHLSQTQIPQAEARKSAGPLDLDLNNDSSKDVDDDLVALCSGKFATQKSASKAPSLRNEDDEEVDADDVDGIEDVDDPQADENEGSGLENGDSELDEDSGDEEDPSKSSRKKTSKKIKESDFFDGEAELSGSDVGSDGEDENDGMTEAEKRKFLKSLISENPGISEEDLQEQVTRLHFKQLLDDDRKDIRLIKELLLADGDLHTDGPGRERSFKWTNLSNDFVGGNDNGSDDSEHEEETEEEAKWKARRLEREKQKKDEISDGCAPLSGSASVGSSEFSQKLHEGSDLGCDESISSVLREANKTLKIVVPRRNVDGSVKRPMSGGFLRMNNAVLQKIAEKVKGNSKEKEGSQTTKNFVFRAVDKPEDNPKVVKRPSSDTNQPSSKRTKLETVTQPTRSSNKRSIFSKF